jgi:alanine racemase
MSDSEDIEGAILTIDLAALVANYRRLQKQVAPAALAAVVKANAYGLGTDVVVPALVEAGCDHFFVAHLSEAIAIRPHVPARGAIYVLNGLVAGSEAICADHGIVPVLNSVGQARRWLDFAVQMKCPLRAILQVDSGMSRLGVSLEDAQSLAQDAQFRRYVLLRAIMSHLACADEPERDANEGQRAQFNVMADLFPGVERCFANSGGCLLGPSFHGDIARTGIALYGGDPVDGMDEPFAPVVGLEARVVQLRTVPDGAGVGYGLSWRAQGERRLATLSVGYADGWPRSLSVAGALWFKGVRLPNAGRISMDSMTVDVTALPVGALAEGDLVELIGPNQRLDDVARQAGTISYEILTGLGTRFARKVLPAVRHDTLLEAIA